MPQIKEFVWIDNIVEKLVYKHRLEPVEIEESLANRAWFKKGPKSYESGEKGYYCLGQSLAGRYIFTFFILKTKQRALVISARDMTKSERRLYEKHQRSTKV